MDVIVERIEDGGVRTIEARRVDRELYSPQRSSGRLDNAAYLNFSLDILGRTSPWAIKPLLQLARIVDEHEIDVIHSHGRGSMKFVALARALRLVRAKHVFHDHSAAGALQSSASLDLRVPMQHQVDAYLGVDARLCA